MWLLPNSSSTLTSLSHLRKHCHTVPACSMVSNHWNTWGPTEPTTRNLCAARGRKTAHSYKHLRINNMQPWLRRWRRISCHGIVWNHGIPVWHIILLYNLCMLLYHKQCVFLQTCQTFWERWADYSCSDIGCPMYTFSSSTNMEMLGHIIFSVACCGSDLL